MAHLTVVGPLHEGLVPVVGTVGDERVHGRISLSKIQNPSRIPEAAQALSPDYDAPIHLHVIVHPNGQIDGMPVSLKDAASAKILRTLVKKFGGSSHAVVLDGDLRRYPQVNERAHTHTPTRIYCVPYTLPNNSHPRYLHVFSPCSPRATSRGTQSTSTPATLPPPLHPPLLITRACRK
jgi:hypothetical protein